MTTVYIPRLIETVEQAEALPIGTIGHEPPHLYAYIKAGRDYWRETGHEIALTDYEMLPFTAHVPIEVEEETTNRWDEGDPVNDITAKRRLATPWTPVEEA